MINEDSIQVVIQQVVKGRHGPYAVASSNEINGSITFSLKKPFWEENDWPEKGMVVVLSELRKKRAGWRAMKARFFKPSDEKGR